MDRWQFTHYRETAGVSVAQLAAELHTSRAAVWDTERGRRPFPPEKARLWVAAVRAIHLRRARFLRKARQEYNSLYQSRTDRPRSGI